MYKDLNFIIKYVFCVLVIICSVFLIELNMILVEFLVLFLDIDKWILLNNMLIFFMKVDEFNDGVVVGWGVIILVLLIVMFFVIVMGCLFWYIWINCR